MRSVPALLLVVVATLVAPFVIATTWLTARVEDRQEYVDAVAPLADDPAVRRVLADAAAGAAVEALQKKVPIGLPDGVSQWAHAAATQVTESPEFPRFWRDANSSLHPEVIALLDDGDAPTDGYLTVDASPIVAQVLLLLEERNIPVGLLPAIPLQVPVVQKATVAEAGPSYRAAHAAAAWLPIVWAVLVGLAIVIAAGWRSRLRIAGLALLGVAAATLLVLLFASPLADAVIDQVATRQQELSQVMVDALLDTLPAHARSYLWSIPLGVALILGSFWPRRRRRPTANAGLPPPPPPPR